MGRPEGRRRFVASAAFATLTVAVFTAVTLSVIYTLGAEKTDLLASLFGATTALGALASTIFSLRTARRAAAEAANTILTRHDAIDVDRILEKLTSEHESARIGAIFSLEALAIETPGARRIVASALESFVRDRASRQHEDPNRGSHGDEFESNRSDISAAIRTLSMFAHTLDVGVRLEGLNLQRLDLKHVRIPGFSFRNSDLSNSQISFSEFESADLTGANLRNVVALGTSFRGAILSDTSLRDSILANADLRGAFIASSDLSDANLEGATFDGASIARAYFRDTLMRNVSFEGSSILDCDFSYAEFHNANFIGTTINGAKFSGARFDNVQLSGSVIANALDLPDLSATESLEGGQK